MGTRDKLPEETEGIPNHEDEENEIGQARANVNTREATVVNLSDYQLSRNETDVLTSGLNFCPTSKIDPIQLCGDVESFFRRMCITEFFSNEHWTIPAANRDNQIHQSSSKNHECTPHKKVEI